MWSFMRPIKMMSTHNENLITLAAIFPVVFFERKKRRLFKVMVAAWSAVLVLTLKLGDLFKL